MTPEYRRWQTLVDKQVEGCTLSRDEAAELERLASSEPGAAHELELLRALSNLECELETSDQLVVERALGEISALDKVVPIRSRVQEPLVAAAGFRARKPRSMVYAALGASVLLGTLALAAFYRPFQSASEASSASLAPTVPAVELTFTAGQVLINGKPGVVNALALEAGTTLDVGKGSACLALDALTDVCLAADTRVVLDDQHGAARRLELVKGHVVAVLEKRAAHQSFSIESGRLRATALGTAFSVERDTLGNATVTVMEGRVRVAHDQTEAIVGPKEQLAAKAEALTRPRRITRAEELRHWSLVDMRKLWKQRSVAILQITTEPQGARFTLDGVDLGQSPLSLVVGSGQHRLTAELEGHRAEQLALKLSAGQTERLTLPLRPNREDAGAAPAPRREAELGKPAEQPGSDAPPSAETLLERARALVRAGEWQAAVAAYQRLRSLYPKRPESHTVLVALGQLELDRLGRPASALVAFNRYLKLGGGLAQEASFGRIRALRSIGDTRAEQDAIKVYLATYPKSADSRALTARLAELEPDSAGQ